MKKLIDIHDELDHSDFIYLEDIFDHFDETELHIIKTALSFNCYNIFSNAFNFLSADRKHGRTVNGDQIEKMLTSAEDIIFDVIKRQERKHGAGFAGAMKNIFRMFFNVYDSESLTRFELAYQNYQHLKDHNEEHGFCCGDGKHWLQRVPEKNTDWRTMDMNADMADYYNTRREA